MNKKNSKLFVLISYSFDEGVIELENIQIFSDQKKAYTTMKS